VLERLKSASLQDQPFPYFIIDEVFPPKAYAEILNHIPTEEEFETSDDCRYGLALNDSGLARLEMVKRVYWQGVCDWLLSEKFMLDVAAIFYSDLKMRFFGREEIALQPSASLGRTKTGFILGPHTDLPHRVITLLFYLPETDLYSETGTSLYKSKDPDFKCAGGPHHGFENFQKLMTVNYLPNTVFGFFKSDESFHGVEPWLDSEFRRDTMQYEISDANKAAYYG